MTAREVQQAKMDAAPSKLRKLRIRHGLLLQGVCPHVGIGEGQMSHLETRKQDGSFKTLRALAAFYEVTLEEVIG